MVSYDVRKGIFLLLLLRDHEVETLLKKAIFRFLDTLYI